MARSWWVTTLVDTVDPRHAWMLFVQLSKYSISMEINPRMAWIYRNECNRHREPVEGGAVWGCRTVGAMDGAIEPPWMGLRRVLQPHTAPPNPQKTQSRLLQLLRPLLWLEAGAGCNPAAPLLR
ncbi:hypothetical protein CLM74_02590 [Stenotrophomonas sp. MYb57]|nr:hypothetical protein CLM74_02590 [Stenotrophomonas sp. MYb57]QBR43012.1 hypothetical protein DAIF1_05390 [Stenotrophomonas indicatrix]